MTAIRLASPCSAVHEGVPVAGLVVLRLHEFGMRCDGAAGVGRRSRGCSAGGAAVRTQLRVDRGDALGSRQEHDLAERDRAGLGLADGLLPALDGGRGRGVERLVDRQLVVGIKAERSEVALELLDVGAIGVRLRQVAIGGQRPVEQDHGGAVDAIQDLARLDHSPDRRQPGDRAAESVEHRLGVCVAERPRLRVGLNQIAPPHGRRALCLGGLAGRFRRPGQARGEDDPDRDGDGGDRAKRAEHAAARAS